VPQAMVYSGSDSAMGLRLERADPNMRTRELGLQSQPESLERARSTQSRLKLASLAEQRRVHKQKTLRNRQYSEYLTSQPSAKLPMPKTFNFGDVISEPKLACEEA
jgi:hypothetical protein